MKKTLSMLLTVLLSLILLTSAAMAQPGGEGDGRNRPAAGAPGRGPGEGGRGENGDRGPAAPSAGRPEDGRGSRQGAPGVDTRAIEEAIGKLTDSTVASNLTALLTAYEEARTAGGETEQATLTALLNALKEAGIDAGPMGAFEDGRAPRQGGPGVDTDAIEEAIGKLTDSAVATDLTALLTAYREAEASGREAAQAALTALLDALKDAGIAVG